MTFKQIFDKARENCIPALRLLVAVEVDYWNDYYETKLTENQFEAVCEFVYEWVSNTEATVSEITRLFFSTIFENEAFSFDTIYECWNEITDTMNRSI